MCVYFFDFLSAFRRKNRVGAKRGRKRFLALFLALACMAGSAREVRAEESGQLQLYAQAAVLMDADSGRVLYGKNEKEILPMASTTKIMTCIVALEYGNPEEIVEASSYAAGMPKVKLGVTSGEMFRLGDLLYSLMLESHNDAAVMIAEAVGGSVEEFAVMMNQKARDIGCYDTYFITPNGLDAQNEDNGKCHSTTAADLARIMAYCVRESPAKEAFLEITRTPDYQFTDAEGRRSFHCTNHNAFLSMMKEALSGKTGFTNKAGYCYVGAVESEGRTFTVALLACGWPNHKTYKWSDMARLVTYGMENYRYCDVYKEQSFEPVPVKEGIPAQTGKPFGQAYITLELEEGADDEMPYLLCDSDRIEIRTEVKKEMNAPVNEGDSAGKVTYYLNGQIIRQYEVLAKETVDKRTLTRIVGYVVGCFLP